MSHDLMQFLDEVEEAIATEGDTSDILDYPQTLVTEKIIFVIDILLLRKANETNFASPITALCKYYTHLKKEISFKPPKFECVLYNNNTVIHESLKNEKDWIATIKMLNNIEFENEEQPLQIDKVFDKIANLVELPHPDSVKKGLPPNWVSHVIWLYGRNTHLPTMENTNSFDYLMMTPFFALDMLFIYDDTVKSNQWRKILSALQGLNENEKGYILFIKESEQKEKMSSCLAQFLGHPLIRAPQVRARFNINELGHDLDAVKNNNDEK